MENFNHRLRKLKRWWQWGLLLRDLFQLFTVAAVVFAAYSIADYFFAFETGTRLAAGIAIVVVLVLAFAQKCYRILKLGDKDMAVRADILLGSSSRPVLGAYEILCWLRDSQQGTEFGKFLAERGIRRAEEQLGTISRFKSLPGLEILKKFRTAAVMGICLVLAFMFMGDNMRILAQRVFFPSADVPPCSSYVFSVSPQEPKILYGGDQTVSVRITGAPVGSPVWFITRYGGKTYRTSCFRESEGRYTQRLEKVVYPMEFCFAVGKARSIWHKVDLLYQPVIAVSQITIIPPSYSGLPKKQFYAGNDELAGLKNSKVELSVSSNRQLLDGKLIIRPVGSAGTGETAIPGVKTADNTLKFSWEIREPAQVEVAIRDVRGTVNKDRYLLSQKLIPDRPPEMAISNPPGFSLATPSTEIPLSGSASDDLGLQKVEIVRAVVGYRDRMKHLGPETMMKSFNFDDKLELAKIGVAPGQVLEFYLEASDSNPDLTGMASSEIVRVQIISEEEYAQMLRVRDGLEDFFRKYQVISSEIDKLRKSLKELEEKASSPQTKPEELAELIKKAAENSGRAADLFDKMALDFPLYDMEKDFAKVLKDASDKYKGIQDSLGKLTPATPDLPGRIKEIASQFEEASDKIEDQVGDAEETEKLAKLMECLVRMEVLAVYQENVVRRLQRLESESKFMDLKILGMLGERQDEIRGEFLKILSDIMERSEKLSSEYDKLKYSAQEFADRAKELEISEFMKKAIESAKNSEGKKMLVNSELALEKLRQLLSECGKSQFGTDKDGKPNFNMKKNLSSSLQQMLNALKMLCGGKGGKEGKGLFGSMGIGAAGQGDGMFGGNPENGYQSGMSSPLNVPIFGPSRMNFEGIGGSGAGPAGARIFMNTSEKISRPQPGKTEGREKGVPYENVPEKYRDAVKKYFLKQEE